jgi:hypothetical protein
MYLKKDGSHHTFHYSRRIFLLGDSLLAFHGSNCMEFSIVFEALKLETRIFVPGL